MKRQLFTTQQNVNSYSDLKSIHDRHYSFNNSLGLIRLQSRDVSPVKGAQVETIKNITLKGPQLEKILLRFVKNDASERLNFRQVVFKCNPLEVILGLLKNQHLKKEINIDLRQNNVKGGEETQKSIDKLKMSNVKIML